MRFEVTRRDVMKFAGGAAIGIALSPAPWKLLDDLAIWTQNGSWIPRVPRGPVTERPTVCALCPAACPVRARCVGELPVQLAAASDTPLCPLGIAGHHLAYHPARLAAPARVVSGDEGRIVIDRMPMPLALADFASAVTTVNHDGGTVALLDMRPGRSASLAWRQLLAAYPNGTYIPNPAREGASLFPYSASLSGRGVSPGLDLGAVRTILSFGAPIAEGWGSPRNVLRVMEERPRLIQVEPFRSPTAAIASLWLPVRPGTEAIVALAVGNLLSGRISAAASTPDLEAAIHAFRRVDPADVAQVAGVGLPLLERTAEALIGEAPAVVVAGEDPGGGRVGAPAEAAIAALNVLLAGVGAGGGLVERAELPSPLDDAALAAIHELDQVPDWSVGVLVIDASAGDAAISWPAVRKKLSANARVIALTPFMSGSARHADLVFAAPAYLEAAAEMPSPFDSPRAALSLSAPLLPARGATIDSASLARSLAGRSGVALSGEWKKSEDLTRARVARIHESGRGRVVLPDGDEEPVASLASAAALWKALLSGARWEDDARVEGLPHWSLPEEVLSALEHASEYRRESKPLTLLVHGSRDVAASAVASPVMTKLYQESNLRRPASVVVVHPDTARDNGVHDGDNATIATAAGRLRVAVATDVSVRPGVVVATVAPTPASLGLSRQSEPGILDICPIDEHGSWRAAGARLEV